MELTKEELDRIIEEAHRDAAKANDAFNRRTTGIDFVGSAVAPPMEVSGEPDFPDVGGAPARTRNMTRLQEMSLGEDQEDMPEAEGLVRPATFNTPVESPTHQFQGVPQGGGVIRILEGYVGAHSTVPPDDDWLTTFHTVAQEDVSGLGANGSIYLECEGAYYSVTVGGTNYDDDDTPPNTVNVDLEFWVPDGVFHYSDDGAKQAASGASIITKILDFDTVGGSLVVTKQYVDSFLMHKFYRMGA